jgi:hypothetical protein
VYDDPVLVKLMRVQFDLPLKAKFAKYILMWIKIYNNLGIIL